MKYEYQEVSRDSVFPIAVAYQEPRPETSSPFEEIFMGALLVIIIVGFTLANLAGNSDAAPSKATPKLLDRARSASMVGATPVLRAPEKLGEEKKNIAEHDRGREKKPDKEKIGQASIVVPIESVTVFETRGASLSSADRPLHDGRRQAPPFNEFEAIVAIDHSAKGASECLTARDPNPPMRVAVTFANSGRVKKTEVENGPFQNTPQGDCIARALRSASVRPFEGSSVTVHRTIKIR